MQQKLLSNYYMLCTVLGFGDTVEDKARSLHSNGGKEIIIELRDMGFPGGAVVKNPPANAGDTGSSPGPGRSHVLRSN